jgi:hypothetical protein
MRPPWVKRRTAPESGRFSFFRGGRPRQAIGGGVRLAGSDREPCEAPAQPAAFGPMGVPPLLPEAGSIAPAMLVEPAGDIPPLVPHPLEEGSGGMPRINEPEVGVAAPAIAGLAEQRQHQLVRRGAAFPPQAHAPGAAERPLRPDAQDKAAAIHGFALLAGTHPGQPIDRRGQRRRHHRLVDAEIAPRPTEARAPRERKASWPGPVASPQPRQTVVGDGYRRLSSGHTAGWGPVIQEGGGVAPKRRGHSVPSFVRVGCERYSTSPPLHNLCYSAGAQRVFTPSGPGADCLPRPRVPRARFRPQLRPGVGC